ncbi:MAG: superinfection immunity protein, partial [Planctomycetota bacterium]
MLMSRRTLGWTVLGWIAALVWSQTAVGHPQPPQQPVAP